MPDLPPSGRVHRRPRHKFNIGTFPYVITPWCLAPVWPGESLVNMWFETREVSPPLASPIVGWGSEWFLFYCKMSDLVDWPALQSMLIDPTNAPHTGSGSFYDTNPNYYHIGPYPNYMLMCTYRIVDVYFRDAEEIPSDTGSLYSGSMYKCKYRDHGLFDSLTPETFDDSIAVPPGTEGMDALWKAQELYDYLVAAKLTDMSYSDWCAAYGVQVPHAEKNEPEKLVEWKEWMYPSNTVDPISGAPSSAFSTVIRKNFNEPRFFKEPGFLIGLHILRPKVYSLDQRCNATDYLNTALSWLPAMLSQDPATSLREFLASEIMRTPPVPTDKYIVDMRDVPIYGDQFLNGDPTAEIAALAMGMPRLQYPTDDEIKSLFKDININLTQADGFVSFDIVGRVQEYTTAHTALI